MNTEELKRLAEAATPGPWVAAFNTNMDNSVRTTFETVCETGKNIDDALYIAAANPAAVLELIRQRDELLSALKEVRDLGHNYTQVSHRVWIIADDAIANTEKQS